MRRKALWLFVGTALLLGSGGNADPGPGSESLRLVVMLRPASPGVVPLEPGDPALYTFEAFGIDEANRQNGISSQVFVHQGRRREIRKKWRGLELTGVVDLAEGKARYQVKLLAHGRQVAATAASIALEPER